MLEVKLNGDISRVNTLEELLEIIESPKIIQSIEYALSLPPKKVVYTSFDGDYLDYIDHMAYIALKAGYTPINPECALGYYVSTFTHNGKKIETMQDCIALELLCDELWLFLENPKELDKLPEGVVAEMISWVNNKSKVDMRVYNDDIIKAFTTLTTIDEKAEISRDILSSEMKFFKLNIKNMLTEMDNEFIDNINERLISKIKSHRRKVIYASTNFFDIKYSDWLRAYCYKRKEVAIVPSQLLNSFVLNIVYGDSIIKSYLHDRLSLLSKTDSIYFVTKPGIKSNIYSIDFIFDYAYWLKNKEKYSAFFFTWDQMLVPKFVDKDWAITAKEKRECFNCD